MHVLAACCRLAAAVANGQKPSVSPAARSSLAQSERIFCASATCFELNHRLEAHGFRDDSSLSWVSTFVFGFPSMSPCRQIPDPLEKLKTWHLTLSLLAGTGNRALMLYFLRLYGFLAGTSDAKDMNNVVTNDEQGSVGSSLLGTKEHATHVFWKPV
jgi:hypothetical protein